MGKMWVPKKFSAAKSCRKQRSLKVDNYISYLPKTPCAMNPTLRSHVGYNEAVLDDNASYDNFFRWADLLAEKLNISFTRKLDDFQALYWEFLYKGTSLTLSFNIFNGISIFPSLEEKSDYFENAAIAELVDLLKDANPDEQADAENAATS